ncbi:mismatch-specific DNA-glycosylase [Kocuria sp. cx-455]|uniref:mismatch-specific DNA-glycosylase n=1 Tax=unclassified Candidatus Sulfotelmatobacter TaxID=2635724 RepID=UPI001688F605|nr:MULTISPECIES: mismatch-specific DNA-glycosylase [unclassified Candidatus Sulfotelmatobacter]MBD2762521.1 mismatch-specific DNA-glycosylase [Kocuria sp. cx-116]MBD2764509.1 mismatch-specific DNA-glycosylase [Kocuria sp. cx-455]
MGFSRAELDAFRDRTVPDLLPDPLNLLFVGINPSLWTAATGAHFARPGNRFYPALHRAGITDILIDARDGYSESDLAELTSKGIGNSNICPRATARAEELSREELLAGADRLNRLVTQRQPTVVAVLGITAYRAAFKIPKAQLGQQKSPWPGVHLWVAPNPSGLNAHASVDDLAAAYREIAEAAGMVVKQP